MEKDKQSHKKIFLEAVDFYKKKDFKAAEVICYKILSIDKNHFDSISLLSNIFGVNADYTKAKEFLNKAIKIQPNNTSILNNLGTASKEMGELSEAISFYKKVLEIDSNNVNANYNLGLIFYDSKDVKKAKDFLEKVVRIRPDYAIAHFNLGNLHKELKELKQAEISYLKAIELKPNFGNAYNNLGLVFYEIGNSEEAIKCYNKAVEINPKHAGAYNNLGRIYTETGDFEKAINSHQAALQLEPENLMHNFYLSELKKDFLDIELKNKIEKNLENNPLKSNLVFGNFLLSRYVQKEKSYQKEIDYLTKAHNYYFDLKGEKFELGIKYCFEDVLQIANFTEFELNKESTGSKIKPIFIIGVPRSGSTLVEKVISSGKKSFPMGEEISVLEHFINNKILEKKSFNLGNIKTFRDEIINIYKEKSLINQEKEPIFTDKSLNNFFYLKIINKVFPEAKVINCKRNVLASIMSIYQNNLTELAWAHDLVNIFKYFDNYFQLIEKFKKLYPGFIYDLDFEKFTNEPEMESKKLMKFCDLPWDQKCLEFYKRKDILSKTTSRQQIRKPIYKNTVDRYLPYKTFLDKYGDKYGWYN